METKHTPGPWTYNETIPRMVSSKQGYITRDICRMDGSTMSAFDQDANARLIAAAPEMLDLLTRARDAIEALDGTSIENEKLVDDYRALMARLA